MDRHGTPPAIDASSAAISRVNAQRSVEWLAGGFRMFMKAPGQFLLAGLAYIVAAWGLSWLGIAGGAMATLLTVVCAGAAARACDALAHEKDMRAGARAALFMAPLWILGAAGAGVITGIVLLSRLLTATAGFGMLSLGMLMMAALWAALAMALWLAPALVALRRMNPAQAIRASLAGSLRNLFACLIFGVLAFVAGILGVIPVGLGLLAVIPVLMAGAYLAYQDIFVPG